MNQRKSYQLRKPMESFWENSEILTAESAGELTSKILSNFIDSIKKGQNENEVECEAINAYKRILNLFVEGQSKRFWFEVKNLYDAGVIKKAAFIQYLMEEWDISQEEAVKYLAENFGMKASTQSVYMSDELILRQKEKNRQKTKKEP